MIKDSTSYPVIGSFGYLILTLCLLLAATPLQGQSMGYDAVLANNSVAQGESTVLHVRFTNCEPATLPKIIEVEGLTVTYQGQNQSSNSTFANGRLTNIVTKTYQFNVTPKQEGTFLIPPIESTIQGKTYKTKALRLSVTKGRDYSQYAFIRVRIPKQSMYVGEMFQMAVDLYEINAKLEEKPIIPSDGFVISEVGQPSQTQTRVGNQVYNRVTFRYLARAVKTGELTIGPITWKVPLFFRNQAGRRQRSSFDSFFRDLVDLNSTVRREVTLKSEPVNLNVLSLPTEDQPVGFTGAVGNFTMTVDASPTKLTAGDPITITMKVTGRGALDALKMPSFESWREFKQYPETASVKHTDEIGLSGTKTFEKVVIPSNAEIKTLPEISYHFFDPLEETYKTLLQAPIALTVQPNLTAASQPTVIADTGIFSSPQNIATNIVHIKPHLGSLATSASPWLTQSWFLWIQLIPLLGWVSALLYRTQKNATERNPKALRKKRVKGIVGNGLETLQGLASQNKSDEFFAQLFRLLQEQIGERLDLPSNAITEAVIESELQNRLSNKESLLMLERLFHTCNQSRYAPIDSQSELSQLANDAENIIAELQQLPDPV
ncbi:BatD family protein [Verrucomicrobia bacterium]|jgi:hypothetical protein|nr:BatD family protein [Verrucomicrobiota bacterium]MDB4746258.1 BatD family protein [Verrucomicrobiota bacterium]